MFNPKICPLMNNGRYYTFFIESDGTAFTLTESEITGASISSQVLVLPDGYQIVDVKTDVHSEGESSAQSSNIGCTTILASGKQGVALPKVTSFDYMYVSVFAHK